MKEIDPPGPELVSYYGCLLILRRIYGGFNRGTPGYPRGTPDGYPPGVPPGYPPGYFLGFPKVFLGFPKVFPGFPKDSDSHRPQQLVTEEPAAWRETRASLALTLGSRGMKGTGIPGGEIKDFRETPPGMRNEPRGRTGFEKG